MYRNFLCFVLVISTSLLSLAQVGCASGGFKLTRQYARFVNKQQIVIRVVLYILTSVVFVATLLIDAVIFNTLDFWEGRVSASESSFEKDGKHYAVKHYFEGEEKLKNTEIRVFDSGVPAARAASTIHISETSSGVIKVYENGVLKATINSIKDLPEITLFKGGKAVPWRSPIMVSSR